MCVVCTHHPRNKKKPIAWAMIVCSTNVRKLNSCGPIIAARRYEFRQVQWRRRHCDTLFIIPKLSTSYVVWRPCKSFNWTDNLLHGTLNNNRQMIKSSSNHNWSISKNTQDSGKHTRAICLSNQKYSSSFFIVRLRRRFLLKLNELAVCVSASKMYSYRRRYQWNWFQRFS